MKIKSDKYKQYKQRMTEIGLTATDCEPADLYGKRVNFDMNDESNLSKTADDIQDVYGLSKPDTSYGAAYGDLAKEDHDGDDY